MGLRRLSICAAQLIRPYLDSTGLGISCRHSRPYRISGPAACSAARWSNRPAVALPTNPDSSDWTPDHCWVASRRAGRYGFDDAGDPEQACPTRNAAAASFGRRPKLKNINKILLVNWKWKKT